MSARHLANIIVCLWGALWTTLAVAQVVETNKELVSLPWMSVLIAGGIAAWGGFVVTLNRVNDDITKREFIIWFFKDLVSAMVAGWFIFFVGGWLQANIWLQATALLAAGYGGSKVLDAASKRLIKSVKGDQ